MLNILSEDQILIRRFMPKSKAVIYFLATQVFQERKLEDQPKEQKVKQKKISENTKKTRAKIEENEFP